jgi:hypothetical protein
VVGLVLFGLGFLLNRLGRSTRNHSLGAER